MTQNNRPLTRKHRIGYALGDFGGCMTFSLMSAFLTRYYVNVALMDTAMIAGMTLAWKRFDALSNPVIGVMLDKSFAKGSGRGDKFRPWIFRVSPLTGFAGILVFTAPGWVAGMSRLVVAFSTYLMYEVCYAAQHIALGGLISAMAKSNAERAELSSARGIGGMLGNIIPKMLCPALCAIGSWAVFRFDWNITPELQKRWRRSPPKRNRITKDGCRTRSYLLCCIRLLSAGDWNRS